MEAVYHEKGIYYVRNRQINPACVMFPNRAFRTQKRMDDYAADDMRCGDLSETQLKTDFNLHKISSKVSPYTLTLFNQLKPMSYGYAYDKNPKSEKITRQECIKILFDEFSKESRNFAFYGPYKHLIEKMINHMQSSKGTPFRDLSLDAALKEQILNDRTFNSTRLLLEKVFNKHIDWDNKYYPAAEKDRLTDAISSGRLPKFDRFQDKFNGMGITVHDTWSSDITIKSLQIDNHRYRAIVHYKIQDHFGLDNDDIKNSKFNGFNFFRIWFVLQRFNQFSFKPFMTNMEATVEIAGSRNESKNSD
ncbi:YPO3983 family protein [Yersinia similis]|uniref:YPO3983 family protein n=1 Tax=Yersinia similis TaxID=367190 RepID=UPI0028F43E1D|nr:YPO3983 family protein [Yersinia similis]